MLLTRKKPFYENSQFIVTDSGHRVRSKSEKIIADKYFHPGIPYRYEYPVFLKDLGFVYTDFTLLDIRERLLVRHEHFGMMQDRDYCRKAMVRIEAYEKDGYVSGRDILYTFEGDDHTLDMAELSALIQHRFFS